MNCPSCGECPTTNDLESNEKGFICVNCLSAVLFHKLQDYQILSERTKQIKNQIMNFRQRLPSKQQISPQPHLGTSSPGHLAPYQAVRISTFSPAQIDNSSLSSNHSSSFDASTSSVLLTPKKEEELRRAKKIRQLDSQISELRDDIELLKNVKNKKMIHRLDQAQPKSQTLEIPNKIKELEKKVKDAESDLSTKKNDLDNEKIKRLSDFIKHFPLATTKSQLYEKTKEEEDACLNTMDTEAKFYSMSPKTYLPLQDMQDGVILPNPEDLLGIPFAEYNLVYGDLTRKLGSLPNRSDNSVLSGSPGVQYSSSEDDDAAREEEQEKERKLGREMKDVGLFFGSLVLWLRGVAKICGITYPYPMYYRGNECLITDNHFSESSSKISVSGMTEKSLQKLFLSENKVMQWGNLTISKKEDEEKLPENQFLPPIVDPKKGNSIFSNSSGPKKKVQCYPLWWFGTKKLFQHAIELLNENVLFLCHTQGLVVSRTYMNEFRVNLLCLVKMLQILRDPSKMAELNQKDQTIEIVRKDLPEKEKPNGLKFEKQEVSDWNYFIHENSKFEFKTTAFSMNESVIIDVHSKNQTKLELMTSYF